MRLAAAVTAKLSASETPSLRQLLGPEHRRSALVRSPGSSRRRCLTEQRSRAQERRAELALTAQGGAAVVAELEALVREHPVREESWRLLALALYDAGRQGDALAALRRAREVLAGELGLDPGEVLNAIGGYLLTSPTAAVP